MSNPEGNVKRIMCFANVYCKQTKVGSITHYSLHIPLSVGWKTLRCFVFQREKKNYFPGWNGGIFSFEIWTVNCYGLLEKKNAKAALKPAKGWQRLGDMKNPLDFLYQYHLSFPSSPSSPCAFSTLHLWFWALWNLNLYLVRVPTRLNKNPHHLSLLLPL